jgi:small-conductance mechanosensitive channel
VIPAIDFDDEHYLGRVEVRDEPPGERHLPAKEGEAGIDNYFNGQVSAQQAEFAADILAFNAQLAAGAIADFASDSDGGKTGRKANPDRVKAAEEELEELKKELDKARSKPNKVAADTEAIKAIERAIKKALDRKRKSEEHARRGKDADRSEESRSLFIHVHT